MSRNLFDNWNLGTSLEYMKSDSHGTNLDKTGLVTAQEKRPKVLKPLVNLECYTRCYDVD